MHGRRYLNAGFCRLDSAMSVYEVIQRLPDLPTVRRISRALAVLDLILNDDQDILSYFSFDARWSETEEAALMRDGSGNEYSIVFSPDGAFAYGFDHESPMSPYANSSNLGPGCSTACPRSSTARGTSLPSGTVRCRGRRCVSGVRRMTPPGAVVQ